jgi:hypothetical protein
MTDSMIKSFAMLSIWLISVGLPQVFFSIMTSIIAFIYFGSMLKINVIDVKYSGSWILFFKSWFNIKKQ